MATKKQKREAGEARAKVLAEETRLSGLRAQQEAHERQARKQREIMAKQAAAQKEFEALQRSKQNAEAVAQVALATQELLEDERATLQSVDTQTFNRQAFIEELPKSILR